MEFGPLAAARHFPDCRRGRTRSDDHDPSASVLCGKTGRESAGSRLADRDLRGLPAIFRSTAGPAIGSHRPQAAAAGEPGGNLRRIPDHGVCALAMDLICGARHRRMHRREPFAGASLHLRCHRAKGSREIVRHYRHCVRTRVPDRTGRFRIARQVRLSLSDLRRRGAVGHQHPQHLSPVAGGNAGRSGEGPVWTRRKAALSSPVGRIRRIFPATGTGDEAVAIFQFCVRLLDVHRGHAAGSRTPPDLGWPSLLVRSRSDTPGPSPG